MKGLLFILLLAVTFTSYGQVPSYVPTNGLAGRWEFNGNTFDESGTGNNGIVNGATLTSDRFGNVSSAYYFDGFNDYWIVKFYNTGNITWQKSLGGSSGDVAPSHQKTLM